MTIYDENDIRCDICDEKEPDLEATYPDQDEIYEVCRSCAEINEMEVFVYYKK